MSFSKIKPKSYEGKMEEWLSAISMKVTDLNSLVLDYLVHEGLGDIAAEFARDVGLPFTASSFLSHRTRIRDAIEEGDIKKAISRINDLNTEIIDGNIELYYFLMEQKACEQAQAIRSEGESTEEQKVFILLEEVLEFIRSELSPIVEENPALGPHFEDLLEFVVFNSRKEAVVERRRRLAEYINRNILEKYEVTENELKKVLDGIVKGERLLTEKYKFPTFNESFI
ncbi:uncharacterized protein Eint_020960 [Encephalitozoon intestinalis ATCC 50506]|uniref:CTLH domain-containing protein n=1 Tax=Encephalitozoon intestinalis (strain ATCC 50506) TaxID=876142 RepID=E0S5V9_ENCIT|nr:uncharacterized protein Eint_020960 [Encephalitozoon intestinalis ATCC 50506]ADM11094.1 hypothetical protein Eint_020960 [Encephalitozoon intestinalis ATCC 50506]UTX44748.1 hypothetical protein GPK93_02g02660 [Encephalitozoon intestinalis]